MKSSEGKTINPVVAGDGVANLLAAIVDSSDDAIISKNLDGVITSWNKSAERIFGYSAPEAIGRHITLIIPSDRRKEEDEILSRIRRGERIDHFETVRVRKDGTLIDLSLTISPVKDAAGNVTGASKVARDITDQKRTHERLRTMERLAAAGQLAASLAHEVNNPLSAVTNAIYLLKGDSSLNERAQELVGMAGNELSRVSRIVRQTLSYHRVNTTSQTVDLGMLVAESLQVFASKLKQSDIDVLQKLHPSTSFQGFPDELRQIVDNLILNAIEAMPNGGRLCISVRDSVNWRGHRRGVRLVIADTGSGIDADVRSKMFEPFFTTKAEKGTGLGLWVVLGLLQRHRGMIKIRSSRITGRTGTVVSIFWPGMTTISDKATPVLVGSVA